mmetsp:Transcript_42306/g.89991  ORF Transcript_42306/g.89991 Transcript_42306/m.89991 type:complete len:351 (-) Transcript_42306:1234-2286(-)
MGLGPGQDQGSGDIGRRRGAPHRRNAQAARGPAAGPEDRVLRRISREARRPRHSVAGRRTGLGRRPASDSQEGIHEPPRRSRRVRLRARQDPAGRVRAHAGAGEARETHAIRPRDLRPRDGVRPRERRRPVLHGGRPDQPRGARRRGGRGPAEDAGGAESEGREARRGVLGLRLGVRILREGRLVPGRRQPLDHGLSPQPGSVRRGLGVGQRPEQREGGLALHAGAVLSREMSRRQIEWHAGRHEDSRQRLVQPGRGRIFLQDTNNAWGTAPQTFGRCQAGRRHGRHERRARQHDQPDHPRHGRKPRKEEVRHADEALRPLGRLLPVLRALSLWGDLSPNDRTDVGERAV